MKEEYLKYLINVKKYSDYTVLNYEKDIIKYENFLQKHNINYKEVTYTQLKMYLETISCLKRTSIIRNISTLRSYYNYLVSNNVIENNVINLLEVTNKEKKLPNFNTYDTTQRVLENINLNTDLHIRDKLVIELLYSTGIRVSELVNIKDNDINRKDNLIKIFGKGNKERYVVYGTICSALMDKYFNMPMKCNCNSEYLILNSKGSKITTRSINNIIYKYKVDNKKMSAHTFRHSCATDLLNNGADLKTVQNLLGHSNISTTSIYTHTSKEKVRNDYLKAHPRNNSK